MAKEFSRSQRVAEQIRRELAELIRLEVKDPRVGFITLTDVEITPDYAFATLNDGVLHVNEAFAVAYLELDQADSSGGSASGKPAGGH